MRRLLRSLGEQVGKVKKGTGVTGERNVNGMGRGKAARTTAAQGTARSRDAAAKRPQRSAKRTAGGKAKRTADGKRKGARKTVKTKARPDARGAAKGRSGRRGDSGTPPAVRVAVRPLDPFEKCGPNTSVQFLYRVDESVEGRSTAHLVFFDHHGWYCEHGRTCPAVGHAKKYNGQIARVS
jgi:hypothetical protein